MLILAARTGMAAYNSDKLATTGLFGIVRNPMYAAWIVFIIPGLVLLTRSWPLFLTPLVAYAVFKLLIRRENEYLEKRFGDEYREYRGEVNELFPWPRKRRSDVIPTSLWLVRQLHCRTEGWQCNCHPRLPRQRVPILPTADCSGR